MKNRTVFEKLIRSEAKEGKPNLDRNKDRSYADKTINDHWYYFQAGIKLMTE